ncbi:MAG: M15 family metallopeptidase [Desulfuromonas sp.]|nr:M15 family metallopeptidase [Desulfuromonas sp.]
MYLPKMITFYSSIMLLVVLLGCAAPNLPVQMAKDAEQQILARTSGARNIIGVLQTTEGFYGIATTLPLAVEEQMLRKQSWHQGCPVELSDLSYLALTHWGFDGQIKIGELVVHRKLAVSLLNVFAELYAVHYPIEKMELIENYNANDDLSMQANNSSAFNCRDITGKLGVFSKHSYGGAIDINPLQNPYIVPKSSALQALGWDASTGKGDFLRRHGYDRTAPVLSFCRAQPEDCLVLPTAAREYIARNREVTGCLQAGSAAVNAFIDQGFDWGGNWLNLLDYQHFEYANAQLLSE